MVPLDKVRDLRSGSDVILQPEEWDSFIWLREAQLMLEQTSNPQSNRMRKSYEDNGYVIAERVFPESSLALLCKGLRTVLDKSQNGQSSEERTLDELILHRESQNHTLVYNGAQSVGSSAATYRLLGSSEIFGIISDVTGYEEAELHLMPLYLIIQLPSDDRFDYTWHQDGSYYPWCEDFLTLWFPINRNTSLDTGTISIIPGSHRYGPRETETFLKNGFFKQIQSKLQADEADRQQVLEMETGDCCIMSGNTIHRSVANRSASPRVAGVLRIVNLASQTSYDRERFYCVHKS
jgi:ectoine hydroxylase-related dioxygenase (phytanoyl-CoA dioxygenase family)